MAASLPDACISLLFELHNRVRAAAQTRVAAQAATARAVAHEQAAVAALDAAHISFDEIYGSLTRVYGADKIPRGLQLASSLSASSITSDVLSEIFRHLANDYTNDRRDGKAVPPAFAVAAVSRHWRRVALSTPSIWTKIRLSFSLKMWTYIKEYMAVILARTRNLPLDLYFCGMDPEDRWKPADEQVIAKALSLAAKVQVETDGLAISFPNSVLHLLQGEMPALRDFCFSGGYPPTINEDFTIYDMPQDTRLLTLCPNLEVLDLGIMPFHVLDPSTMSRICSFSATGRITTAQLYTMPVAWSALQHLELGYVVGLPQISDILGGFPRLESLKQTRSSGVLRILDHVKAPELRALTLECKTKEIWSDFTTFIRPDSSCPSLRTLTLTGKYARLIPDKVCALPNLATLRIAHMEAEPLCDLLRLWTSNAARLVEPPRLQQLHLDECGFGGGGRNLLVRFLQLRSASAAGIQVLRIAQTGCFEDGDDIFPQWMEARLRQLVKDVTIDTATALEMLEDD